MRTLCCVFLVASYGFTVMGDETPPYVAEFVRTYCATCHGTEAVIDANGVKSDFRIDRLDWKLNQAEQREQWELVRERIADGDMPPKSAAKRPDAGAVKAFLQRLEADFAKVDRMARPGGTPVRRLNRVEYLNTVRDLFGIRMINLPASFPDDAPEAEFDTMPDGMFLSPAVMEAYHDVATDIANRMVPLPGGRRYQSSMTVEEIGGDATRRWFGRGRDHLKFIGFNQSGWSGALWDALFVAPQSGTYRVRLLARAQAESGADDKPLRLSFYAFDPTVEQLPKRFLRSRAAWAGSVDITSEEFEWVDCDIQVEAGETFHVYCDNRFPEGLFPDLPVNRSQVNTDVKVAKNRDEPTVELRAMQVEGPVDVPQRVKDFFEGYPPKLSREELERRLLPIATKAYRRPLSDDETHKLLASVLEHAKQTGDAGLAWHYAFRRVLCSPAFLYREVESASVSNDQSTDEQSVGWLSNHALASRLSYALWSTMPDDELLQLADNGTLSQTATLKPQIRRLVADSRSSQFVKHFTGQWLGNRTVESINVCDTRYEWDENVRYGFVRSTEMFFQEVLQKNLPIATFIDSDFTYANSAMRHIWGFRGKAQKNLKSIAADQRQSLIWPEPDRVSLTDLPENAPAHVRDRGGLLGLPGVLTVTGDGVESSPILRGVWVLENLFGQSPPPPPGDVPALDIDTSEATSVREILTAHRKVESCAACHRDIDPLGLALENYDAIGGWRVQYAADDSTIDPTSTMPDGTPLAGPHSIKAYLLQHRELFTRCLLTKLLEYAAGRQLSVGDQRIVDALVDAEPPDGYRFRDLLEAALTSDVLLAK